MQLAIKNGGIGGIVRFQMKIMNHLKLIQKKNGKKGFIMKNFQELYLLVIVQSYCRKLP